MIKMVTNCLHSSGEWQPGFRVVQLFHLALLRQLLAIPALVLVMLIQAVNGWQSTPFTFFRFIFLAARKTIGHG